ncbi:gamma-butyrobetaine dioxygenase-like [Tigriopus californicus]|uniref:gamma-butyrobetaine dioxygenase-like n=1 Tax=Tigriopus californicus TaxID=6832 RepID=UPI0027DAA00D|nr:gamma-butyrobetaine dioxygenase-like [Tigriopus californicus]
MPFHWSSTLLRKGIPGSGLIRSLTQKSIPFISSILRVQESEECLTIETNNSESYSYPFLWLRDNCQCPQCFNSSSQSRSSFLRDLPPSVKPSAIQVKGSGLKAQITWNDGHESTFESQWLLDRVFSDHVDKQVGKRSEPTVWDASYKSTLMTFDYEEILTKKSTMLEWLQSLDTMGLTMISGMPPEVKSLPTLIEAVAFPRSTHYGQYFEVIAKAQPNNTAYTTSELSLHLDLPYYKYKPGTQFLHCIKQFEGQGGDNRFVDGLKIAQILARSEPKHWNTLKTVPVTYWDYGSEDMVGRYLKFNSVPTFELDRSGRRIHRINYSDQVRASHQNVPLAQVTPLYQALIAFSQIANSPQNCFSLKLSPGQCVVFDNLRVLHSREGFTQSCGNDHEPQNDLNGGPQFPKSRHIHGAYIDWDEIESRMNVLKLEKQD